MTNLPNEQATIDFAGSIAKELKGGEVIALNGDLGTGKTTFVRALAAALGSTDRVKSPTFTLLNQYSVSGHSSINKIIHADLYRLKTKQDLASLNIEEQQGPDTVVVIEWANAIKEPAVNSSMTIEFEHEEGGGRSVSLK